MLQAAFPLPLQSDQTRCIPFQNLKLFSDQFMEIQLDGEPMEGEYEVDISVHPKALRILTPAIAPRALFSEEV